jgi:hypothetical protein
MQQTKAVVGQYHQHACTYFVRCGFVDALRAEALRHRKTVPHSIGVFYFKEER